MCQQSVNDHVPLILKYETRITLVVQINLIMYHLSQSGMTIIKINVSKMNSKCENYTILEMIKSCDLENLTSDITENIFCKLCNLILPDCNHNISLIDYNTHKSNFQNQD